MSTAGAHSPLQQLQRKVIACRACPRLVRYLTSIRKKYPAYWCKPVPSFGDANAKILILGLAPGRFGSNRTGRMFTGDASGKFLYRALYKTGLCTQPEAIHRNDGQKLKNVYISAVVRCAPPQNKPLPEEVCRCIEFLRRELKILKNLKVVLALGKIAHDGYLKLIGEKRTAYPFRHGALYAMKEKPYLLDSYHVSRQNTQTGRLNMKMFLQILRTAKTLAHAH